VAVDEPGHDRTAADIPLDDVGSREVLPATDRCNTPICQQNRIAACVPHDLPAAEEQCPRPFWMTLHFTFSHPHDLRHSALPSFAIQDSSSSRLPCFFHIDSDVPAWIAPRNKVA
jgi:hypothetical protein